MIHHGDCREVMAGMEAESFHSIVTDPPYGLSFMGKGWDHGVPGAGFWTEALRVAKPGAHLLAFGGTRTHHRLMCAIEDAGWEVRDVVMWVYGSGFPKGKNVAKTIDASHGNPTAEPYEPTHPDAVRWNGWNVALKPAYEPIIVARKPLVGTVAANVLEHGCGGLNIDGCRVEGKRWPANFIHDGSDEVVGLMPESKSARATLTSKPGGVYGGGKGLPSHTGVYGFDDSGSAARFFYCAKASKKDRDEGCGGLEEKRGGSYANGAGMPGRSLIDGEWVQTGTWQEPNRKPRRNHHPTVKPTDLMRYLCRLVTPPGGTVLDPFCGSGSTGKAAALEGFNFVGIEQDADYIDIARARIAAVTSSDTDEPELFSESA